MNCSGLLIPRPRSGQAVMRAHARQSTRNRALLTAVAASTVALGLPVPASAAHALAARALQATDTAALHFIKSSGSLLYEEGAANGTLPGQMHARCDLGATFTAAFTLYLKGGTISGRGTAKPHGSGIYESFAGTLTITGGTGRYSHAHGQAGLYGTFDRRTYAIRLKTTGSLAY